MLRQSKHFLGAFIFVCSVSCGWTYAEQDGGADSDILPHRTVRGFSEIDGVAIRQKYELTQWEPHPQALRSHRVVVIGNSFDGFVEGSGQLPLSAKIYPSFGSYPAEFQQQVVTEFCPDPSVGFQHDDTGASPSSHDLDVAKLHWKATGGFSEGPHYALVIARNPLELDRAMRFARWWDARLVLTAQNFPDFGNKDGLGDFYQGIESYLSDPRNFIVASSGNYNRATHSFMAKTDAYGNFIFANNQSKLRLRMRTDGEINIMASWDSFGRNTKDLGIRLIDEDGRTIYKYETGVQVHGDPSGARYEIHEAVADRQQVGDVQPREKLTVSLQKNDPGKFYYIELFDNSKNFTPKDEITVVISAGDVKVGTVEDPDLRRMAPVYELIDWTPGRNVFYPADHKDIVAVSEVSSYSSRGPTVMDIPKGDVVLPETNVSFSTGITMSGTSPATAIHAAQVSVLACRYPELTRREYRRYLKTLSLPPVDARRERVQIISSDWDYFQRNELPSFESQFPQMLSRLASSTGHSVNLFGRDSATGHYVLGYQTSPGNFTRIFEIPEGAPADSYEYYVAFWLEYDAQGQPQNRYETFTRKVRTDSFGEEEAYPWMRENAPVHTVSNFVELKRIKHRQEREREVAGAAEAVGKFWKMPTLHAADSFFAN